MTARVETCRQAIGPLDANAISAAAQRWDTLTKPRGSRGRLEALASRVAGITGVTRPRPAERLVFVLAGDPRVVAEGVSAYPADVTAQMVYNSVRGGGAINVLARHAGARVVDIGAVQKIRRGAHNFAHRPGMTPAEALACIEQGVARAEEEITVGRPGWSLVTWGDWQHHGKQRHRGGDDRR
jgi:nicotinate-nucleotide--dimethylbenzimidazole phosphoribosyltransferase